jgi:IS5 family transposase
MRISLLQQLPLAPVPIDHSHARQLGAASLLLDQLPEAAMPVHEDLSWRNAKRVDPTKGRHGMAAEQVLRAGMLKQINNFSYEELAFHKDVAFNKRCRLEIEDMVSSSQVYRKLRAFRAGVEGTISFLKRVVGLGRCLWRGFASFKAYVQASVLACNLLVAARHVLAARG